jgi:transposase InsO family protein
MPWGAVDTVTLRREFVVFAQQVGANRRELCRRYGISPKTGYKWIHRYLHGGLVALADRSRRPRHSPRMTPPEVETAVVEMREDHEAWGGRKIRARLIALGFESVPAASTITDILRRHGLLEQAESEKHTAWGQFEREEPNSLWQMDFKGHFALSTGRCHPLSILDDHSRYATGLFACANERGVTVRACLEEAFRRYGFPDSMLMDNGSPWGCDREHPYTPLTVWLLRVGVRVSHPRPYHPQTQGKDERFHRTLKAEVLRYECFHDLAHCQRRFDQWRGIYNHERPHEALGMAVPASRYRPSSRRFPEALPAIEYAPGDVVRKVQKGGAVSYRGREYRVSKAFCGYPVAFRPTITDGVMDLVFCNQTIAQVDLREPDSNP